MPSKTKNKKLRPLTQKQVKFVKGFVKTGNGTVSVMENYSVKSPNVAAVISSENLRKPNVIAAITEERESLGMALARIGVDAGYVAQKLKKMTTARVPIYAYDAKLRRPKVVGYRDDHNTIDKGLTHVIKIRGDYAPEKHLFRGRVDFGKLNELTNDELKRIAEPGKGGDGPESAS